MIRAVKVEDISQTSSATMNQMLDAVLLLLQKKIPLEGLDELALGGGDKHMSEPLDNSVMQSLLSKC